MSLLHDYLSTSWQQAVKESGYSELFIFIIGTMLVHSVVFWGMNGVLFFFYSYNMFPECRIQGKESPKKSLTQECLKHCLINHFIVAPITLYFGFPIMKAAGMSVSGPLPSLFVFLRDFVICVIANDTLFYWGHRLLHHPSIYKYVHKQHHEFKINTGISSEYAHPVEHLFSNLVPVAGNLLMGSHVLVFWVWLVIRIGEIVDTHSGYEFKYSPYSMFKWQGGADRHEFHHSHNTGCFGSFTIFWDQICGTDEKYNQYRARKDAKIKLKQAEAVSASSDSTSISTSASASVEGLATAVGQVGQSLREGGSSSTQDSG